MADLEAEVLANLPVPDLRENHIFDNQILRELSSKGLIKLREVHKTFEKELPTVYFGDHIEILKQEADEVESIISELNPFKPRRNYFLTVKHTENTDSIRRDVKNNLQKSKTTELGKQFIQFIENPVV